MKIQSLLVLIDNFSRLKDIRARTYFFNKLFRRWRI